jgi:hypothetical protein
MRVLVCRGGELAAPCSLVCDNPTCDCHHALTALDSHAPVQLVTVAERPDITEAQLTAACRRFLQTLGFTGPDMKACAADMAHMAVTVAADHPAGTRIRAHYDDTDESWTFTPDSA